MPQALTITTITDLDVKAVIALWRRCDLIVPWNDPEKDIAFARTQPNAEVLLGWVDGHLAASTMVGHDGHRGAVYYVSVDPDKQGSGYGRDIMDAACGWLKDQGIWKLNIIVRGTNTKVIGFYEGIGAKIEDRVVLAKRLTED